MLLEEPVQKKRGFLHKILKNLTKLLFGGYRELPKPPPFRPFLCGSSRERDTPRADQMDGFYADYCDEWRCDFGSSGNRARRSSEEETKEQVKWTERKEEGEKEVKVVRRKAGSSENVKKQRSYEEKMSGGDFVMAKRMKELEMLDVGDVEQVLDIEEALHYYSRLRSPVYVEIVEKFFMDMYSDDFSTPQQQHPSLSKFNTLSRRRLGSIRL